MHLKTRILLRTTVLLLLLTLVKTVDSQEMWGVVNSNFAGSNGALLNPSSIVTSKLYMDINLVTADVYVENNYLYIHASDYSLTKFLKSNPEFPKYGPDEMAFDRYSDKLPKNAYINLYGKGPSFMLARGRHAIALHTGVRYLTSMYNVPYDIANFGYFGLDYTEQQNINYNNNNIRTAVLAFGEVGLTYAYSFRKYDYQDWSAGLTIRRLFGVAGGYMYANNVNYTTVNDSTIDIKNLNAELGYAMPMDYNTNEFPDAGPTIKGGGWGFDIGISYQQKLLTYQKRRITKLCRQRYTDYIFKAGVSLLDVGYVKFTNNAQKYAYDDVSRYWVNIDTISYQNMNQLMRTLSDVLYNDPDASYRGNEISVLLPAAFSVQFDYRFTKGWYAGAVFIHSIPLSKNMVYRPTQIMVSPRYETPHFEASLPVSLYEWRYPRVGLSLRYHFLTIGTENLSWLFGLTDFTGMDFYFSIKVNFSKGNCSLWGKELPCENDEYGLYRKSSLH
jgi:hypothetical protein